MREASDRIPTDPAVFRSADRKRPAIMPIDQSHVALHIMIVTAEERRHPGRIAGAPESFNNAA